jgi:4-carboxymuconolactone decarboxylase
MMKNLPGHFSKFLEAYPKVAEAYNALGTATAEAGPLDIKTQCLIKLGMAVASAQEGATHSHVRKSLEAGASADEIRHAVILATTTLGFPTMMRGLAWVGDVLEK